MTCGSHSTTGSRMLMDVAHQWVHGVLCFVHAAGDRIIMIDGRELHHLTRTAAAEVFKDVLQGTTASHVVLVVQRTGTPMPPGATEYVGDILHEVRGATMLLPA